MYRSFVFARELVSLLSGHTGPLRLSSPGTHLAGCILRLKGIEPFWDNGIVGAEKSFWSDIDWTWIVGNEVLRVSHYEPYPDQPVFSTTNADIADHLLHLGAEEIEYRDPTPLIVWKIEVFDTSGDVAGWVEPLLDKYKYLGVPL